ncbi:MAG TPA: GNAT family N-acetyltransferase [Polyangiaceae bacterium]
MSTAEVAVVPFAPEHTERLLQLFERCDNTCFCRYLHFAGDKHAWQDRLANAPERNRDEFVAEARSGGSGARGVIALLAEQVVGWLKVSRASDVDKLYQQRLYRGLPCFDRPMAGVFTLGCFLVDPEYRGRGLSRELIRAGVALARSLGATSVEALPRGELAGSAAERWLGRPSALLAEGFQVVHDFEPYPVLRRVL